MMDSVQGAPSQRYDHRMEKSPVARVMKTAEQSQVRLQAARRTLRVREFKTLWTKRVTSCTTCLFTKKTVWPKNTGATQQPGGTQTDTDEHDGLFLTQCASAVVQRSPPKFVTGCRKDFRNTLQNRRNTKRFGRRKFARQCVCDSGCHTGSVCDDVRLVCRIAWVQC